MDYIKNNNSKYGYCVVPLSEVENDWKKVALVNRLLRINWTVYRNKIILDHYPAGSFFVPLKGLPVSEVQAKSFLDVQAQEFGISLDLCYGDLPIEELTRLIRPHVAVLYDTGEKWALMALRVLETMEFDVNALNAEDIRQGALDHANILLIPGGTHTDKAIGLGSDGETRVRNFLRQGGGVLGFCGGAALSAQIQGGWGLLAVERENRKIPKTMHGPIWIKPETADHPLWYGYPAEGYPIAPWYGRAFHLLNPEVKVLGRYDRPTNDFYIDHELTGSYFSEYLPEEIERLDKVYDGYANPESLKGMVAIAEGKNGDGRIIVSYPHPETPGLEGSFLLLANAVFYVIQKLPLDNSPWLPIADNAVSYDKESILSLLNALKESHSSFMMPISKELVRFGISNLYWAPRPNIPWCYIGGGKYSFYICERLEAYGDEILRHLNDIPRLINQINIKFESLCSLGNPRIDRSLKNAQKRVEDIYRFNGSALSEILESYRSRININLPDWIKGFKRLLLYRQLLTIMKDKGAEETIIKDVTQKSQKLAYEYLGGWRWVDTSEKYKSIFNTLDNTCLYLSNLKFDLVDVDLKFNELLTLYDFPGNNLKINVNTKSREAHIG